MDNSKETNYNLKGLLKYISTVVSWTLFVLLVIVAVLLIYYYVSVRLYSTKGERFEPKFSVYTVVSESMEPTINKYDVIINTKIDKIEDVKVNDVITYISTWQVNYGMTITHRVIGTKTLDDGSTCLVTRGDNNTSEDPICVQKSNVIGVVKAVIPNLGKVQFFLSSSLGWLLVILLPAVYIIIKDVLKIFNLLKDDEGEEKKDKTKKIEKINNNPKKKEPLENNKKQNSNQEVNEEEKEIKKAVEDRFNKIIKESKTENKKATKNSYLEQAYEDLRNIKNKH